MLVLIAIGLVAGFVTAVSPCVLPVLPILFAGGATGGTRRPLAIIGGLIVSFSAFTLGGVWLLDELGLPKDFMRDVAIALLFLVAAILIFPRFGQIVERPLYRLSRRPAGDLGGGFVLGASLGLVFVPCAGPVLAAITVLGATNEVGWRAVVLTVSYSLGAAVPMLAIAYGGAAAMQKLRPQAQNLRRGLGVVVALTALAIAFNLDRHAQTAVPDYVKAIQDRVERSDRAERELAKVRGPTRETSASLIDYGAAPSFTGIGQWINTPDERPLTIAGLRGKVVLIDFWTYSCINCLRTLPHLRAWDRTYREQGLQIVGVHTPEFAFEHVEDNVRSAIDRLDLEYAVAMDNDFGTWNAYSNRYWPAKYLIDARGHLRYAHFGEGAYDTTESHIRALLAEAQGRPARAGAGRRSHAPGAVHTRDLPRVRAALARAVRRRLACSGQARGVPIPAARARGQRVRLRRTDDGRGATPRRRAGCSAAPSLPGAGRPPGARRGGPCGGVPGREEAEHGAGRREPALHAAGAAARSGCAARAPVRARGLGLRFYLRLATGPRRSRAHRYRARGCAGSA